MTATGEVPYQPVEQAALLHWAVVVGAVESPVTVKLVAGDVRPALLVAVTLSVAGTVAPAAKL